MDKLTVEKQAVLQSMVDQLVKPCAILAVEKTAEGGVKELRIVCANQEYKTAMGGAYYDGMPYDKLVPKQLKFENSCLRCAFQQQQFHTYLQMKGTKQWIEQQLIPLHSDREDVGYCQFILEFTEELDRERLAGVSMRTAASVLRAAITLLGTNDLKERVLKVLTDILEFSEAFQVRVVLMDHEGKRAVNYCNKMAVELPEDFEAPDWDPDKAIISYPLLLSWAETIGDRNSLVVTTEEEMEELSHRNPGWVRTLRLYNVTSLILIPLRWGKEIVGYLYMCNFNAERVTEVEELVGLMSFFLGTVIYNEVLLKRLDELSHTDALTSLRNRNAMIQHTARIAAAQEPVSFGVVNLDLNGLKITNDLYGHEAGDRLLVNAAEILKKYFYDEDLYRTGGDEFIVISTGITREAFDRKVERLRQANSKGGVSFAVGAFWSDGTTDVTTAFHRADEAMYADKKAYYEAHPEFKR
jgi:diguanylate cyclase (GGDEF)-like protein